MAQRFMGAWRIRLPCSGIGRLWCSGHFGQLGHVGHFGFRGVAGRVFQRVRLEEVAGTPIPVF